jgi:GNAT superfamily N-acetyltransferase
MIEVAELEGADEATLRAFYDVEIAAHALERPYAVHRTFPQLCQMAAGGSEYFRRTLLVAREGGRILGTADLGRPLRDNLHLADLEVRVLPEARRRGIGGALHDEVVYRGRADGRTTFLGEAYQPNADVLSSGTAFARALGYDDVQREDHQVLDLPAGTTPQQADGYEVLTWMNRAPDDLMEAYSRMRTQMLRDMPSGEVDWEPVLLDPGRLREEEQRVGAGYDHLVAVVRRTSDGELGGYSKVFLPHDLDFVVQDDTMVMGAHRGRGLGLMLKSAVLAILAADRPERRIVHTWNAVSNAPMQRINGLLGFRPVELMLEMQRKDADA